MKFADKYELSDAVTSGRLETFMGRDVNSGERVLVHIFDAPVKQPGQPTVLWALESFRAVAPEAPGLVIAAGRYETTSFAYLVTRVPEDAALRQWTRAYESSTAETREIPIEHATAPPNAPPIPPSQPRAEEVRSIPLIQPGNPPTGFFGLRPPVETNAKAIAEEGKLTASSSEAAGNELEGINFGPRQDSPRQESGEFTKQFFVGSSEPKTPTAPVTAHPVEAVPEPVSRAQKNDRIESGDRTSVGKPASPDAGLPELGGFTALFSPGAKAEMKVRSVPGADDSFRNAEDAKAGDFTKFFQGPFDGERPSEIPNLSPNVTSAPRGKVPGEFTQMFGTVKDNSISTTPLNTGPVDASSPQMEPGSFTRSFADGGHISSTSNSSSEVSETKGNGNQKAASFEPKWTEPISPPVMTPANPPAPITPRAGVEKPRESRPSVQGGATQLFSVPGGHSVPTAAPPPSGPSEYTRIISGGMVGLTSAAEPPAAEEGPAGGGLPTFKMPAAAVPPAPKIAAPVAPKLPKMPPALKVPPVGALVPKPKSSYLPMIIILNISLIVAVLLIVYFAIKH